VTSGREWVAVQDRHGVEGWVRVWEVTDGSNGWHVHVHFVVVLAAGSRAADFDLVADGMFDRWSRGLVSAGREAPLRRAQEWHLLEGDDAAGKLGEYLFEMVDQSTSRLGFELTHTAPGRARVGHKTVPVWTVLEDFMATGDCALRDRWHEWEQGSKGKRQMGTSKGLFQRFAPSIEEVTDEQIADREVGSSSDDIACMTSATWAELVRDVEVICAAHDAYAEGGVEALFALFDLYGLPYQVVLREGKTDGPS
jgi:hypothetical protein